MAALSLENRAILTIWFSVIMVIGIIGNLCVICSILASKVNRKNMKNSYVLTLSIADALFCSLNPSYFLIGVNDPKIQLQDEIFCRIMSFLCFSLGTADIMAITALSLDRYLALKYPFFHRRYQEPWVIFLVNFVVYMYPLAWYCPVLVKEGWVQCFQFSPTIIADKKSWQAYSFSLSLLVFVFPGVILAVTNVYVFVFARKRYFIRKNYTKQTPKPNRISDTYGTYDALEINQLPESSRKKVSSKSRMTTLTDTSSFKDTVHMQSVTITRELNPDEIFSLPKLQVAGFGNRALFQKIGHHQDACTTITADQQKLTDIEERFSVVNKIIK